METEVKDNSISLGEFLEQNEKKDKIHIFYNLEQFSLKVEELNSKSHEIRLDELNV